MVKGKAAKRLDPVEDLEKPVKQARLPGTEDAAIEELEELAQAYAQIRDKRQMMTEKEVESKAELLKAMKKHKKTIYNHKGISIEIIPEGEKLKVRITDPEEN